MSALRCESDTRIVEPARPGAVGATSTTALKTEKLYLSGDGHAPVTIPPAQHGADLQRVGLAEELLAVRLNSQRKRKNVTREGRSPCAPERLSSLLPLPPLGHINEGLENAGVILQCVIRPFHRFSWRLRSEACRHQVRLHRDLPCCEGSHAPNSSRCDAVLDCGVWGG